MEAAEISGNAAIRGADCTEPYFIDNVRRLVNETDLPLIEVGGIRTRAHMEAVLRAGAKAFSVSRPLICDPEFPTKIKNGDDEAVIPCHACGKCFRPMDMTKKHRCVQFE